MKQLASLQGHLLPNYRKQPSQEINYNSLKVTQVRQQLGIRTFTSMAQLEEKDTKKYLYKIPTQ